MDSRAYYENFNWEEAKLSEKLGSKIQKIISIIPGDVNSILDVGCGDGVISKGLQTKYKVFATDRSINSLKYVETEKFQSSTDNLPVQTQSIDLVFSSEMIEHLPDEIFYNALDEFRRVSKKYIMLTFPNNENLEKNLVQCPNCNSRFNKSYHLRSITANSIQVFFSEYKLINSFTVGTRIRGYNNSLSAIKHKFTPSSVWIPKHWTPDGRRSTMCPKCNTKFDIPYNFSLFAYACDALNMVLSPKKPYQICVLLEK
jgi:SAM-dependent methyltransferase